MMRPTPVRPLLAMALVAALSAGCAATRDAVDATGEAIDDTREDIANSELWQDIEANWNEFSDAAADRWRELTDDDIDDVGGNRESLIEEISEAYDMTREEAADEVDEWADALDT